MSERYWISGVQLGIIKALAIWSKNYKEIDKLLEEIEDKQFIGDKSDLELLKKRIRK